MAKTTLTFEDAERGTVNIKMIFDTPLKEGEASPGQLMAVEALRAAQGQAEEGGVDLTAIGKLRVTHSLDDAQGDPIFRAFGLNADASEHFMKKIVGVSE